MQDTLSAYLGLDDPKKVKAAAKTLESAPELARAQALPGALRSSAADAIIWCAKAVLNGSVSGVMGDAWSKTRELQRFLSAPAGQVNEFTLHSHEIALSRTPSLELVLNNVPTGITLRFEVKVGLTLTSAKLKIMDGRITAAEFGEAQGAGSLSLGRATIIERKTSKVELPTRLAFTPGIPLRG